MVGEPWYQVVADDAIEMHPAWKAAYLPSGRILLSSAIPIRARCLCGGQRSAPPSTRSPRPARRRINVANTNTYGGCFHARYSRISGFLSARAARWRST